MLVLDSTILIDYLRGRPAADRLIALADADELLATTAINEEEIARGVLPKEEIAARALFSGLVVLPIGEDEAWQAGAWRRKAAHKGETLSQADCLIASATALAGARLATGNPKDFTSLPIPVEHWPVGK